MEKSLDGIKKLNPEEVKKYRKIVLNYIGEKDSVIAKEQKNINQPVLSAKKVDGIKLNKIYRPRPNNIITLEKSGSAKEELIKLRQGEEQDGLKQAIKRQEEERRRIKEEDRQYRIRQEQAEQEREFKKRERIRREELRKKEIIAQAEREAGERARAEEAKKWREKLRLEEKEREEKGIIKENKRLEKIKRAGEIKRIKQEVKLAKREAAAKKKIKRQKAIKQFKKNLKNKLAEIFYAIKQNFVYSLLFLIAFLAIGYVTFCLAVLRFKIDNNIIKKLTNHLPVPAVITNQGIINYYDFQNIKNNNYLGFNPEEKKNNLVKWLILRNLKQKYGLAINASANDLAWKFIMDKEFNQVGVSRINKISDLLKSSGGPEQFGKYADEYNDGAYYSHEGAVEKFGPVAARLAVGQVSDIILRANGYYIIKRIDDKNGQIGIKYLFVRAQTPDQYINKKLEKAKAFILVN